MKKILLSTIITCSLIWGVQAQAITLEDVAPSIGDSYTQANSEYVDPGTAGQNQTWDFSAMVNNEEISTSFVNP